MEGVENSEPGKNLTSVYRDTNLQIVFGVTLVAVLGVSSITPAFPRVLRELRVSTQAIGLLITVFTLPGVFLTPVLGVLADRWGRKRILVPSLMLFGVAGGACALARDFNLLLALRFLQGVGAASLGSLNVTVIGDLYSGEERAAAMGYNASVLSVGTASYPALGGALAMLGWHYPFVLPIVAIPVGLVVLFSLDSPEPRNKQRLEAYLSNVWQGIKNRRVLGLFAASIVTFIILYGSYLTYFPILMQGSFGASSLTIGLIMSSMSLTTAFISSQLGRLTRLHSEVTLLKVVYLLYALALAIVPFVSKLPLLLVPTVIFGIAQGINIPSVQTLLAGWAPAEHRAAFMSLNGMVLRLGQTLGPLVTGAVFEIWGIGGAFFAGAGFSLAMFVVVLILIGRN
jgi:predicted MFS family arabinose efflux permease